ENYGGAFPTWLAPVQVEILPVNDEAHGEYAKKVYDELRDIDVRAELVPATEKLGYRLRNAQVNKIPYTLVLGEKEAADNSVTYRVYGDPKQVTVSLDEFKKLIREHIDTKARF
ncbi:MAG: threonine--tRNA ligase, partial [Bacilli bacterium]|nr:threonine--tRNA ligase [Bacilli bacterium]